MRHVIHDAPPEGFTPRQRVDLAAIKLAMDQPENKRRAGEDVCTRLERVNVSAGTMLLSECSALEPVRERIPGEDDE